ncbi:reverse transcriptase [Daphnia sinensis]|uniref:Reverse transcriptase n=1 Tax=Daphnia sinensis TaxID=1820382 RepID=A0AAD5KY86_9CRUS|nr:reverse transcriptase [Daphnia sinensis]
MKPKEKINSRETDWRAVQFKVLDIVRPIFQGGNSPGGHAHFSITALRRKNILKQTHPTHISLLRKEKNFKEGEYEHLFGDTFHEVMVKSARDANALKDASATGRNGGPYIRSERSSRGAGQNYRGGHNFYPITGPNNPSISTGDRGQQAGPRHQNQRYSPLVLSIVEDVIPVGGCLKYFSSNWTEVSRDPWILEVVGIGLSIEFTSEPVKTSRPGRMTLSVKEMEICDQEIASLLRKKAIKISLEPPYSSFLSPFFGFVHYRHFKMEGNSILKHLVKQGDWFAKIDLRDAYLTVPIHLAHQRFLQLQWRDIVYEFTCLLFGLSSAPWAFTKLLRPVAAYSKDNLTRDLNFVKSLLEFLGFLVNLEKSVGEPTQEIEFLGLVVNSVELSVALPKGKEIAVILGKLAWAIFAGPFAPTHYRDLQYFYICNAKKGNMKALVDLSENAQSDITWWVRNLRRVNGRPLSENDPDLVIFSDASLSGWGGCCNDVKTRGPWAGKDRFRHINELEPIAAFHCLKVFANHSSELNVLMQEGVPNRLVGTIYIYIVT